MDSFGKSRTFCTYIKGDDPLTVLKEFEYHVDWYIGQDEAGTHGMQYIQLMIGFKNPRPLNAIHNLLKDANIQAVQDAERMYKYVADETKRDEDGILHTYGEIPSFFKKNNKDMINEAVALQDFDKAMQYIEEKDPLYHIQNQKKIEFLFCGEI